MEEINDAIGSNNQQTTTIVSTMTTVAGGNGTNVTQINSQTIDDFEPDPKWEITTLEKASYDCSDMYIDSLPNQQQDVHADKDKEVEHIQREIISDCNLITDTIQTPNILVIDQANVQQSEKPDSQVENEEPVSSPEDMRELSDLKPTQDIASENVTLPSEPETFIRETLVQENEEKDEQQPEETHPNPTTNDSTDQSKTNEMEDSDKKSDKTPVEDVVALAEDVESQVPDSQKEVELRVESEQKVEEGQVEDEKEAKVEDEIVVGTNADDCQEVMEQEEREEEPRPAVKQSEIQLEEPGNEVVPDIELEKTDDSQKVVEVKDEPKQVVENLEGEKLDGQAAEELDEKDAVKEAEVAGVTEEKVSTRRSGRRPKVSSRFSRTLEREEKMEVEEDHKEVKNDVNSIEENRSKEANDEVVNEPEGDKLGAEPEASASCLSSSGPIEPEKPVRLARSRVARKIVLPEPRIKSERKPNKRTREPDEAYDKSVQPVIKTSTQTKVTLTLRPAAPRATISTAAPSTIPDHRKKNDRAHDADFGCKKYSCDKCRFSTDRINNIMYHLKNTCASTKQRFEGDVERYKKTLQSPKSNNKRTSR